MKKARVIITRKLPLPVEKRMGELFDVTLSKAEHPIERQELVNALKEAEVLVPTTIAAVTAVAATTVTQPIIEKLRKKIQKFLQDKIKKWKEVEATAIDALIARKKLWDIVLCQLR